MQHARSRLSRRIAAATGALVLLASAPAYAQDGVEATNDGGDTLTNQGSNKLALDFGLVCAGSAPTLDVTLAVVRDTQGGDNTDFADGADIEVTSSHVVDPSTAATDSALAAGAADDITLPSDWVAQATGTSSDTTVSTVTMQAGSVLGSFLAELRYDAEGPNAGNGNDRNVFTKFDVTATIVHCVEGRGAPAIANEYLRERADGAGNTDCRNNVGTNKNKSNWHGNLISAVAHEFEGTTFTEDDVHEFVEGACLSGLS